MIEKPLKSQLTKIFLIKQQQKVLEEAGLLVVTGEKDVVGMAFRWDGRRV